MPAAGKLLFECMGLKWSIVVNHVQSGKGKKFLWLNEAREEDFVTAITR